MEAWQAMIETITGNAVLLPFFTVVVVLLLGVMAQILAYKLRLPGIIFLLLGGVMLGPSALGLIRPEVFGDGLRSLVALCVALIVFEGAMMIDLHHLKRAGRGVLGLISVGAILTTVLTGLLTWAILGLSLPVAFLFGAIVSVTGPTVIQPILARLSLTPNLKATLEGESVFVDAVGVLMAAAIFTVISYRQPLVPDGLAHLGWSLLVAIGLGAGLSLAAYWVLKRLAPLPGTVVRFGILSAALSIFVLAELFAHETGIMAIATAGVVFGSLPIPYAETMKRLERDLTMLALSLVFVLLAAMLPIETLFAPGWQGLLVVALVMLLVRPLAVAAGTWGSALTRREKVFMALFAPRGIVAASTATFFALELEAQGHPGAGLLAELVFLVVIATVLIEGAAAPWLAEKLGIIPPKVFILGGDKTARKLAERELAEGEAVQILEEDLDQVHALMDRDLPVAHGRLTNVRQMRRLGADQAKRMVVATGDEQRNLLLVKLLKRYFPQTRVFVRLGQETDRAPYESAGAEPWPSGDDRAEPLPLSVWNSAIQPEAALEARVFNPEAVGVPLAELALPGGALLLGLKRGDRMFVPRGYTRLRMGDVVTVVGERRAVDETLAWLEHR